MKALETLLLWPTTLLVCHPLAKATLRGADPESWPGTLECSVRRRAGLPSSSVGPGLFWVPGRSPGAGANSIVRGPQDPGAGGAGQSRKAQQDLQCFLGSVFELKISPRIQTTSKTGIHIQSSPWWRQVLGPLARSAPPSPGCRGEASRQ